MIYMYNLSSQMTSFPLGLIVQFYRALHRYQNAMFTTELFSDFLAIYKLIHYLPDIGVFLGYQSLNHLTLLYIPDHNMMIPKQCKEYNKRENGNLFHFVE